MVSMVILEVLDIESTRFHRPNVVSYEIVTGIHQKHFIRDYLPPANMYCHLDLEEAINHFLERDTILVGN